MFHEPIRPKVTWRARFAVGCAGGALICGLLSCAAQAPEDDKVPVATVAQAIVLGPCADGTQEQTFAGGMVGCAGAVPFANRSTLCAPGYRTVSATEWMALRNGAVPTHDYWTNDDLKYSGSGTSACSVSAETGTSCGTTPMRVCTTAGTDAEGNQCNWQHCGFGANTPDQFFGGCAGNTTAGALCIVGGCADGSIEQTFAGGMVGCAASATFANRATLCGPGYRVATAAEWVALRQGSAPAHDYWTNDSLLWSGSGPSACAVSTTVGSTSCGSSPMRVCTATGTDAEGNTCNWTHCGLDTNTPDQFFGGCLGNAGALCVPNTGCADGSAEQVFDKGMVGCAGSVAFASRDALCAPGYQPATAAQWVANRGTAVPTHDYWTDDSLLWSGSGPSACAVSTTVGNTSCGSSPMRVCTATGTDAEGNTCNWTHCGLDANTPDQFFGGCLSNAGTLCMPVTGTPAVSGTNVFASHFPVGELHATHAAGTAGSAAAAAIMGAQGYGGAAPPVNWENAVSSACTADTVSTSLWPACCDPSGLAAAMTASTAHDWNTRTFADVDQASALDEMVASLEFYRSPAVVPIYGQADHWVAVTQITASNLGGGAWSVSQVKLFDGGPSGQLDSSGNSYGSGLLSFSGTVWANVYYQPVTVINPSCDAAGCTSDPYFQRYVLTYDPPRGVTHPPVAAVFAKRAPRKPSTMDGRVAPAQVWDALASAGLDADPEIWNAIRGGVPGAAFQVHARWASGNRWDYWLVPILANADQAIAFVQLAADDGSFDGVHVLARPVRFAPVTMARAEQLAHSSLAGRERLTAGRLTWSPGGDVRIARSPSAPYYEFGIVGATRKPAEVVRVTLDRGIVVRGR